MKSYAWPDGIRCPVFLSLNFDAEVSDLRHTTEDRLFGRFSYGRYGIRAGLPRLLGMLGRRGIAVTVFVTASDAIRHPDAVRALRDAGHEIASRGADLTPLPTLGESERGVLEQARDALAGITGEAPKGFRAAGNELGPTTLRTLAELGYTYDSSFQDHDHPYVFATSASTKIAEVPTVQVLDDSLFYASRHTHARVMKVWREEFEGLYGEGCLVPLTMHLRGDLGSTRAARVAAMESLLSDIAGRPGVRFLTGAQLGAIAMASGAAAEGDPFLPHEATLKVTPFRGDLALKPG